MVTQDDRAIILHFLSIKKAPKGAGLHSCDQPTFDDFNLRSVFELAREQGSLGQTGIASNHGSEYPAEAHEGEKEEEDAHALDESQVTGFADLHPAYEKSKYDRRHPHADHHAQEAHGPDRP